MKRKKRERAGAESESSRYEMTRHRPETGRSGGGRRSHARASGSRFGSFLVRFHESELRSLAKEILIGPGERDGSRATGDFGKIGLSPPFPRSSDCHR